MTADRAEWTGVGAALLVHLALIAALSMSLAHVAQQPEPPSMEVELVDDVALQSAAPAPANPAPPPPAAEPEPAQQLPLEPPPQAVPLPTPTPAPLQRPQPPRQVQRPQPPRAAQQPPAQPAKRPGLDKDFLKSFDDDLAPRAGPAAPVAAKFDARAQANVASLIARQIEPCARRQRHVADSASSMSVVLGLNFLPNGQLRGRPSVVRVDGLNDDNQQYRDLAVDQAIASYTQCAPLRLPANLYSTPQGGWKTIKIIFDVR